MITLSKKHKIALGFGVLVIGLIASSFGFGTDDNLSSNATSPLKSTQEERITNMNGEITNIKNQLIGLEKTLEQKRNDLSVRDGRITDKNLQIAELQTYITKNCDDPTGTAVNLCKKKGNRVENIKNEIKKLLNAEKDIEALIEAKPQVEKILADKEAEILIMQMKG